MVGYMWTGSFVALITPFDAAGNVDYSALERLILRQVEAGSDGIVLCGTTGEGSSLSQYEKEAIFRLAVNQAKGHILIIAATGTNQTRESVALTEMAKEIGVDGCMAIVPYYNRPSEEGCYRHFAAIADAGLPVIVYHHPGRTGVKLSLEALLRICKLEGVVALKEASADLLTAQELVQQVALFSGDDCLALAHFAMGATGSISIVGNLVPREWKAVIAEALRGDFCLARELYFSLYPLINALVLETNPICVKYAASLMGLCSCGMRLPLVEPSKAVRARLLDELRNERCPAGLVARS